MKIKKPGDSNYNLDWDNDTLCDSLTLDKAIQILESYKKAYGGDTRLMINYDSGAGYDDMKSIYPMNFHNNLILMLSCLSTNEASQEGKIYKMESSTTIL